MNKNILYRIALILILFGCQTSNKNVSYNISNSSNRDNGFDTLLIRVADYTGDGVLDTEKIHIVGESFKSPLSWIYDLRSNGQVIYHHEGAYDLKSDSFFFDPRYVGKCSDYYSCKSKFFYKELGMETIDSTGYANGIANYMKNEHWGAIGLHFIIDSCGVHNKREAELIVDSISSVISKTKPKLFAFCFSPVESGSLMIYVKRFNCFIPVYHE